MFEKKRYFAERVAMFMHAGQVDKAGEPYIDHVRRVAEAVEARYPNNQVAILAAWLHDVVEDTPLTLIAIKSEFGHAVANAVKALSRNYSASNYEYYANIANQPTALLVKIEDIADNADPARLAKLPNSTQERLRIKYENAMNILSEELY